jgi:hypothetical protein
MNIGFTGTQKGMTLEQKTEFELILKQYCINNCFDIQFHHGDCTGADSDAHTIVDKYLSSYRIWIHPPKDDKKRAWCSAGHVLPVKEYIDRNHDIVDSCDILIATPRIPYEELRSGTWATIRYARTKHKTITIIYPDGQLSI